LWRIVVFCGTIRDVKLTRNMSNKKAARQECFK